MGLTGRSLGELVGEMVLRLAHDHILPLRITSYADTVLQFSAQLNRHSAELQVGCGTDRCVCVYKCIYVHSCLCLSSVQRFVASLGLQCQRRLQPSS